MESFGLASPGSLTFFLLLFSVVLVVRAWRPEATPNRHVTTSLPAFTILVFSLLDWILLSALPRLELSFGPLEPTLGGITALRVFILLLALIIMVSWRFSGKSFPSGKLRASPNRVGITALWLLNLGLLTMMVYSLYIEPFNLQTTELNLSTSRLALERPLRIVHLSDLHVERITKREQELVRRISTLQPDLILMTGDYLNIDYVKDPYTRQEGRNVLSQLSAPYGVYAVPGSPPVDTPDAIDAIFEDLKITLLQDEVYRLEISGGEIDIVGLSNLERARDSDMLKELMSRVPANAFTILMYHTPDLAEAAAQEQVDLYLAGHTHGGQVRLPWWGALVTMSAYGKKYQSGLYNLDQTKLYVSRGIGMEGLSLPRIRFLCPPEVVLITLGAEVSP